MGRHKIEIKKIDEKHSRQICFTKRRKGLFKKANDLARQGFHVAVVVRSAANNTYVYGSPNADSVVERFVYNLPAILVANQQHEAAASNPKRDEASTSRSMHANGGGNDEHYNDDDKEMGDSFGDRDDEEEEEEEEENKRTVELSKSERFWWNKFIDNLMVEDLTKSDRFWWNKSIDNLGVEELREFTEKLKLLASTVKERADLLWIEKPLSLGLTPWR